MESIAFRDLNKRIGRSESEILNLKSRLAVALNGSTIAVSALPPHGFLSTTHVDTDPHGPILGDIVAGLAGPIWGRVAGNTTATKKFLSQTGTGVVSAAPTWSTIAASDIGSPAALTRVNDTNVTLLLGGSPTVALLAATSLTLGWAGQLSIARGGTGQATALAAFNALSPLTTTGDLLTYSGGNNTRLGVGAAPDGYVLTLASGAPSWAVAASGSTPHDLLDGTQDQDTVAHAVVLGDLIYGNVTPKWAALAGNTTGTKKFLTQTGTGAVSAAPAWGLVTAADVTSGAALTKTDDTNVTITLTGSPTTALLAATDIAPGWTGTLSVSRGGIGVGTLASNGVLYGNGTGAVQALAVNALATHKYLQQFSSGAPSWAQVSTSEISGGAALTNVDDTNVTLAISAGGATALLTAASITAGWTGTLAVARGGIGVGTLLLNGVLYGNGTSAVQAVALNAAGTNKFLRQVSSGAPTFASVDYADLVGAQPTVAITMTYYFEVNFLATSGTHIARLFDISANIEVSGSQITTTSTTSVRVRSSSITFIAGHEYRVEFGGLAGGSYTIYSGDVVVVPSNGPTTYISFGSVPVGGQTSTP